MAARSRKRKFISLNAYIKGNESSESEEEEQTWADLPRELLEKIMTPLELGDNLRSSSVCKNWLKAALSVRVSDRPPWLVYFPRRDNLVEFYNPMERKTHILDLPELAGCEVCYSKDGWLLMWRMSSINDMFFFNPFTRQLIELPKLGMPHNLTGFSCDPTSSSCLVFAINHLDPYHAIISTCHPDATEWTSKSCESRFPFLGTNWNKLVFANDVVYCLSLTGWLAVFDPCEGDWNVLPVQPPECPDNVCPDQWWKGKSLVEHKGDIFIVYTSDNEVPAYFRLNLADWDWEPKKTLDGLTVFTSFLSCEARSDLLGRMRDCVYFPKVLYFGSRCLTYKADERRYYPRKNCFLWEDEDPTEHIWITAPENVFELI